MNQYVPSIERALLGEYVGAIYTRVQQRPYAIEQERINFQYGFPEADQDELPCDAQTEDTLVR